MIDDSAEIRCNLVFFFWMSKITKTKWFPSQTVSNLIFTRQTNEPKKKKENWKKNWYSAIWDQLYPGFMYLMLYFPTKNVSPVTKSTGIFCILLPFGCLSFISILREIRHIIHLHFYFVYLLVFAVKFCVLFLFRRNDPLFLCSFVLLGSGCAIPKGINMSPT